MAGRVLITQWCKQPSDGQRRSPNSSTTCRLLVPWEWQRVQERLCSSCECQRGEGRSKQCQDILSSLILTPRVRCGAKALPSTSTKQRRTTGSNSPIEQSRTSKMVFRRWSITRTPLSAPFSSTKPTASATCSTRWRPTSSHRPWLLEAQYTGPVESVDSKAERTERERARTLTWRKISRSWKLATPIRIIRSKHSSATESSSPKVRSWGKR